MAMHLWECVENDDFNGASELLEKGARVDERSLDGFTPLMIAAGHANVRMVQLLLNHKADVLCIDRNAGLSALHKACQGGSADVVRLLIEAGAFVDLQSASTGHTPLMDAIWYKWPDIVEYLLSKNAGLNVSTRYGFTLQQHIDYERSVNFFDKERFSKAEKSIIAKRLENDRRKEEHPLMSAVMNGDLQLVLEKLKEKNLDIDERFPVLNGFNDNHTALHVACRDGHTEIAAALIERGANVNAVEPVFGAVPLHKAVYNGHLRITESLVKQREIDLNFQGMTNGYTPLHDALWHGFADCALVLINAGARLDIKGHDGKLPTDIALEVFGTSTQVITELQKRLNLKST